MGPKSPPECDRQDECRFQDRGTTVTVMGTAAPVYSRNGAIVSTSKLVNVATTYWHCLACGKEWNEKNPAP